MKYFVKLIMAGALICAVCFTSCEDDKSEDTKDTKVQSVTPTQSTVYIQEGLKATIAATVAPNNANQGITWTSENPNVVAIDTTLLIDGISASSIMGVSLGSTTIIATSVSDPGKNAAIQVTVTTRIDSVTVDIDRVTFVTGATETATVNAAVMPANAIQTVTWTSSNPSVATVSNGVIRAVGAGSAIITVASTNDPSKRATVEVRTVSLVNKAIHVASKFGNGLTVSWVNLGGDMVEFFYTNEDGQRTSLIVPVTTQSAYIPDFGSAPLSYRTLYFSGTGDTLRAPMIDFKGSIYDLTHYIRSSPAENIINAGDFDIGGNSIGFYDNDNANTSLNYRRDRGDTRSDAVFLEYATPSIGNIKAGFWWNYTVIVLDAGYYEIDFHISVGYTTSQCHVKVDGEASEDYLLRTNSSWVDWRYYFDFNRLDPPKYYLTAGKHVIQFYVASPGLNYDGLSLTYKP
jgi:uncharacterized protein YjdB